MVAFLTFLLLVSLSVGVFFARAERDYGIALIGWTLTFGSSVLLFFGIVPNDANTFFIHPDFFRKLTMVIGVIAFVTMLLLSLLVTASTNRDRKELKRLNQDRKILMEELRAKRRTSTDRPPIIIDMEEISE